MYEITNKNFEEKYPEIYENLRSAAFLTIDCEFSGLVDCEQRNSVLDSVKEVFERKQKSLGNYHIVEFGLSVFKFDRDINNFTALSYSFYLLPFVNQKESSKLTWQLGSIDFLCKYNFDFNKVFYDGISYLNKADEAVILDMINNGTISEIFDGKVLQEYYRIIIEWSRTVVEGKELEIELEGKKLALKYVLQFEIRNNIANTWTSLEGGNVIKVKKISKQEKVMLLADKKEESALKKKIFDSIVGFSKIIQDIERLQKPVIGHNLLGDLILIYQQFYSRTPVSYSKFKEDIHRIFPCLYDTKVISSCLHNKIPKGDCWDSSSLCDLYLYFKKGNAAKSIVLSPIVTSKNDYTNVENFHEAGFDSFCTGYCFVKMAYMLLLWDEKKMKFAQTTVSKSVTTLLAAVKHLSNYLHIAKSNVKWIALNGPEPKRPPPLLLLIQSKGSQKLNFFQISEKLSQYHSADFKPLDRYSGLIAVGHRPLAKEIRNYFEMRDEFEISDYSFLKHSFWGKTIVRSFYVSAVLGVIITSKVFRLSKFISLT